MLRPFVKLLRESDINDFLAGCDGIEGLELLERVLDYLNVSFSVTGREMERIPAEGRLIVLVDHVPGLVEAALLMKLLRQVRADVRLASNSRLSPVVGLRPILLPNAAIRPALDREQAVVVDRAADLPRDPSAPVLSVTIGMRPARFYGLAAFLRRGVTVRIRIGEPVPRSGTLLGFRSASSKLPVSRPEDRLQLRRELQGAEVLGETADGKRIHLFDALPDSAVLRELGRLRELAFRQVGEGTGKRRDIDAFDAWYRHVVLWDDADLQIVGAYRIGEAQRIVEARGTAGLYTHGLFEYCAALNERFGQALELGRSFVQPRYQGMRALDYLWHGVGAYLRRRPEIRYLFGPVSLSAALPEAARRMIVHFFRAHFGTSEAVATPRHPYEIPPSEEAALARVFPGVDYAIELRILKQKLGAMGIPVPVLYKQYGELCDPGGTRFLAFNVDPAFSCCVDGLVWVDLSRVKAAKKARYLAPVEPGGRSVPALAKSA